MATGKYKKTKAMRRVSLTPEEKQMRSIRAKRRFKAIVWLVMANRGWLEEDDEDDGQLGDNVRKNVQLLTRKKGKKSLITKREKTILSKAAEDRTESEKQQLNRIIGGLKCFRKYPPEVKSQLAGVTYFMYYPAGRVLIKQNHPGYSLYFLLSGEVTVSQTNFDPVLKEMATQNIGTMVAGSMFGEVSLLHGIARTATITTATPCELLCLKKDDFDVVLKASVMEQWNNIMKAMEGFTYFDGWDEVTTRECCILAKLKNYAPNDTLLGDGVGLPNYAYFVIEGQCSVIEHLPVRVTYKNGRKLYSLYELSKTQKEEPVKMEQYPKEEENTLFSADVRTASVASVGSREDNASVMSPRMSEDPHKSQSKESTGSRKATDDRPGSVFSKLPRNVQIHFMQCCFLNKTAVFCIGENINHRRVVAVTDVTCLLIPKYWLMQKNKGNIWNKVAQFLNSHIPSTQKLFKEFVIQRRWLDYRRKLVHDVVDKKKAANNNTVHNVPYSIRVRDDLSYNYRPKKH